MINRQIILVICCLLPLAITKGEKQKHQGTVENVKKIFRDNKGALVVTAAAAVSGATLLHHNKKQSNNNMQAAGFQPDFMQPQQQIGPHPFMPGPHPFMPPPVDHLFPPQHPMAQHPFAAQHMFGQPIMGH